MPKYGEFQITTCSHCSDVALCVCNGDLEFICQGCIEFQIEELRLLSQKISSKLQE